MSLLFTDQHTDRVTVIQTLPAYLDWTKIKIFQIEEVQSP